MSSSPGSIDQMDLYDHCQRSEERKEYIKEGFKDYDEHFNNNIKSNAETMEKQKKSTEAIVIDIYPVFGGANIYNDNNN